MSHSTHICSKSVHAISDGRAGNARQANALAGLLASDNGFETLTLEPRPPWRWAAPRRWLGAEHGYGDAFAALLMAPPALAVGCGRQAALATRLLRERGARTVQILDPRLDPAHWDLVVVPEHDPLRGPNVIPMLGSLHPVDDGWLAQARRNHPTLADLPSPRTAFLLGGNSSHARFDRIAFEAMAAHYDALHAREGGSMLITTSRRTDPDVIRALANRYRNTPGVIWRGDGDGPNPYPGLLAWADRIVCSPDSVNMISEACATRVPVFVFDPGRVRGRPRLFIDALLARGRIREMDAGLKSFDVEPLREAARVRALVAERLNLKGIV